MLPFLFLLCYDADMILLDGKKIAEQMLAELKTEITQLKKKLRLGVVAVGEDPVARHFIEQKRKIAESIGMDVRVYPFPEDISTNELRKRVAEIVHEKHNSGVIIQLPLPLHINRQYILNAIVPDKDVDMLSGRAIGNFVVGKSKIMPPVVGAIDRLLREYTIDYADKQVAILGAGRLVGKPVALWLLNQEVNFYVVQQSNGSQAFLQEADIIITGIGKPKFVTSAMVKEGVVVIDAGTSESEGKMVGDVDFDSVSAKAGYITPVPGGVGPLTIAMLFQNLVSLVRPKGE